MGGFTAFLSVTLRFTARLAKRLFAFQKCFSKEMEDYLVYGPRAISCGVYVMVQNECIRSRLSRSRCGSHFNPRTVIVLNIM